MDEISEAVLDMVVDYIMLVQFTEILHVTEIVAYHHLPDIH